MGIEKAPPQRVLSLYRFGQEGAASFAPMSALRPFSRAFRRRHCFGGQHCKSPKPCQLCSVCGRLISSFVFKLSGRDRPFTRRARGVPMAAMRRIASIDKIADAGSPWTWSNDWGVRVFNCYARSTADIGPSGHEAANGL